MTFLSRRKPRTTVPPRRRAGTAYKLAGLVAAVLAAGGAATGQFPGRAGVPSGPARPQTQPAKPAPPGGGGKVMYFHKPANALLPASGTGGGEPVAQSSPPGGDAPTPPAVVPLPPAAQERPIPATPTGPALAVPLAPQPGTTTANKKQEPPPAKKVDPKIYTVLPERDKIFVIYDDDQLQRIIMNRIREDDKRRGVKSDERTLQFPATEEAGAGVTYVPKTSEYPPSRAYYASLHLVHRRLHFEEKNAERYGWDLGFIQPLVSTLYFYKDVLLWPNSLASGCHYGFWDTNAGKCLPGSPTPYFLYPPGLTVTGSAFEAVVITGAAFALP